MHLIFLLTNTAFHSPDLRCCCRAIKTKQNTFTVKKKFPLKFTPLAYAYRTQVAVSGTVSALLQQTRAPCQQDMHVTQLSSPTCITQSSSCASHRGVCGSLQSKGPAWELSWQNRECHQSVCAFSPLPITHLVASCCTCWPQSSKVLHHMPNFKWTSNYCLYYSFRLSTCLCVLLY